MTDRKRIVILAQVREKLILSQQKLNRLGLFWIDREQICADFQAEIKKHEIQTDYDRRSFQKLCETIESQQEELHRAQVEELHRRNQQLLHEQLLKQNWDLREAHEKSLNEMKELKQFQGSTLTLLREEDQSKIKILSWNLLARYRNCKMKLIV